MKKEKKLIKKNEIYVLLLIVFIFLIGMFIFSKYTSPLYPYDYGYDSAIFTLMGKGINNNKIIYKDLFDHKGPLLFFIEALGYYIGKFNGIFLLQCLSGILNLIFIYGIWKMLKNNKFKQKIIDLIFVFITFISIFFYTFEGGNLSEEYSLPFILCCLYLFTKYAIKSKKDIKHPYSYSLIYGICFTSLALIRINNAITVISGVLSIIIYLIYKKEIRNLLMNILFGIIGCLIIALPFIIYFYNHSALYEMIYATFIYNFKYVGSIGHNDILSNLDKNLILYIPLILSLLFIIKSIKSKNNYSFLDFILHIIVLFNIISLLIANTFPHYFTIYIPVFIIVILKYWNWNIKSIKTILLLALIIIYIYNCLNNFIKYDLQEFTNDNYKEKYMTIKNDLKLIPNDEKNYVIGYNIPAAYYLIGDILPCYKYYIHQEWWSISNPNIKIEFLKWLENNKVLWLITLPDEDCEEINKIILNNYELKHSNDYINVYRLNN